MQDRSDGEEESDEDDDDGKRLKPDDLGIDHCLELGQEAAHVGEVYEKVPLIIEGTVKQGTLPVKMTMHDQQWHS